MYITRRMARLSGMDGLQWATDITKVVQDAGGMTSLWMGGPGSTFGTIAWSTMVDSFAAYVEFTDMLATNDTYAELAAQGAGHIDTMEPDQLMQIVHGEIDGPAPVGSFMQSVTAQMNPERTGEAMEFAPLIIDAWTAATGVSGVVVTYAAGAMGEVNWLARHASASSIDDANAKAAASASYAEASAGGAGLFTDGNVSYARRVA